MFQIKDAQYLKDFYLESYQNIMSDLSVHLEMVSRRLYDKNHIEELYRFGNIEYFFRGILSSSVSI